MLKNIIKKLIIVSVVFFGYTVYSNDVLLYSFNGKPELTEVVNNALINLPVINGKTYTLKNGLSIDSTTNCLYILYSFPNKLAIAQMAETQSYFNEFDIEYKNNKDIAEPVNITKSDFIFSFIGSIYCKSDSNYTNIINTKLTNIKFSNATLFVKSDNKYTHVYVINGNVTVVDSKSTKKQKELKEGDYLVVTPKINLTNSKGMNINTNAGNSFSMRELEEDEQKSLNEFNEILQNCLNNSLFINYQEEIIGIKLK